MAGDVDGPTAFRPLVVLGLDATGRCTFLVGPGLAEQGLDAGELVGRDLHEHFTARGELSSLTRALSGNAFTTRTTVGGRVLHTSFEPVLDADGRFDGAVSVTTDVTDHVRTTDELSRFKALVDDSPNMVAIADEAGRISYVNPRLADLDFPLASRDIWTQAGEVMSPSDAAELEARIADGERWSGELTLPTPTGEVVIRGHLFPLRATDDQESVGTGWIAEDITELRASETKLRATNADLEQFQALVDASSDFIAIAALDGTVRYVNPAGRAMVGLAPDLDVSTTLIEDYLTPEGLKQSLEVEQPAVVEHGRWLGESTLKRTDGSAVPVEISSFLVRDLETGAPFALATVQRDITERLAVSQAQQEFIALVAHELRTPLASVKGYVELAGDSLALAVDPAKAATHLIVAERNIVRIERLVEQILSIAGEDRHHRDERRPLDLVTVVAEAVESARLAVEAAGIRLDLTPTQPVEISLDESFVEVVDNLVSNAVKHTPVGGTITVGVSSEDGFACLTVADSGSGVPANERATIFDKFVRGSHQSVPGLGLGLFITHSIVHAHDGEIVVDDRPGGGARFVVRLPLLASGPHSIDC